jgi:GNAT superfamily N-acetyltransferase
MLLFSQAKIEQDFHHIRELFTEYIQWIHEKVNEEYGLSFDVREKVEQDLTELDMFSPPSGRFILASVESEVIGMGCIRRIRNDIGEIKRMDIRPKFRRKGYGRAMLEYLLEEGKTIGYPKIRLDSARFMHESHALYQSSGFLEIEPYPESEIPREIQEHWIFMEKVIS